LLRNRLDSDSVTQYCSFYYLSSNPDTIQSSIDFHEKAPIGAFFIEANSAKHEIPLLYFDNGAYWCDKQALIAAYLQMLKSIHFRKIKGFINVIMVAGQLPLISAEIRSGGFT
jgi:hypothetical protein